MRGIWLGLVCILLLQDSTGDGFGNWTDFVCACWYVEMASLTSETKSGEASVTSSTLSDKHGLFWSFPKHIGVLITGTSQL